MVAPTRYEKAPIREALCAFTFEGEPEWDETTLGKLMQAHGDRYPGVLPLTNAEGQPIGYRFSAANQLVHARRGLVSIHQLGAYVGWQTFRTAIEHALVRHRAIIAAPIREIGMRYINEVELPVGDLGQWFQGVPLTELDELTIFQTFTERLVDGVRFRTRFTVSLQPSGGMTCLLDHDLFLRFPEPMDDEQAMRAVDELHDHQRFLFEGAITEALRERIR